MPHSGFSALHGVNHNLKKDTHTHLFHELLIYLIDSLFLCMFTHMRIVLFSSHAY